MTTEDRVTEVIRAVANDVLAYFERRLEQRDDAADLLGETLATAWRRRHVCPGDDERARMWVFTIAANVHRNYCRGIHRRWALTDKLRQHLVAAAPGPDDQDSTAEVADALHELPDHQRELLTLIHWDGFTVAEAGAVLGVGSSTARTRYASAKDALRRILRDRAVTLQ